MKKRNILLTSLLSMWMLILLVATSYAWISRTWTPSITADKMEISTAGALVISLVSDADYNADPQSFNTIKLNDLLDKNSDFVNFKQVSSSDGKVFHAVDFSPLLNKKSPTFTSENVKGRYIDVTFYLKIQAAPNQKDIYLHPDSIISDIKNGSGASDAMRIAITINDGTTYILHSNKTVEYKDIYAAQVNANGKNLYAKVDAAGNPVSQNNTIYNLDAVEQVRSRSIQYFINNPLVRVSNADSTTKVNLKIWLEGGDENCVQSIAGEAIKLLLKFEAKDVK